MLASNCLLFCLFCSVCILSETNCLDTGLLIEVWNKGLIWDKAMGHYWLPLHQVPYSNEVYTAAIISCGIILGSLLSLSLSLSSTLSLSLTHDSLSCVTLISFPSWCN